MLSNSYSRIRMMIGLCSNSITWLIILHLGRYPWIRMEIGLCSNRLTWYNIIILHLGQYSWIRMEIGLCSNSITWYNLIILHLGRYPWIRMAVGLCAGRFPRYPCCSYIILLQGRLLKSISLKIIKIVWIHGRKKTALTSLSIHVLHITHFMLVIEKEPISQNMIVYTKILQSLLFHI